MGTNAPVSANGPDAARALQTTQPNAVATPNAPDPHGTIIIRGGADSADRMLERVEASITMPPAYQYGIPIKGRKDAHGNWDNSAQKVGITVDGYDYLNRVLGCTFYLPEKVHDENGNERPNPIHRGDYIYLRLGAVWRNPIGQLVGTVEDVEVDFKLLYQNKRANAKDAEIVMGDNGPLWDEAGNAVLKLSPAEELKAYKELTQNRSFGPRYAITVARVRILKMATGIRSMPYEGPLQPFPLKIVGFRDMMTPQERVQQATGTLEAAYGGRPADIKPLTSGEAEEAGLHEELDADEASEREAVAANLRAQADDAPPIDPGAPVAPAEASSEPVWDLDDIRE